MVRIEPPNDLTGFVVYSHKQQGMNEQFTALPVMNTARHLRNVALAGLVAVTLTNCAPTVMTTRLTPISGEVATIDGRPVTRVEENNVAVVASFEREDLEYAVLDIEVKNNTSQPIEVDPAGFRFVALGPAQDTLSDTSRPGQALSHVAANPTYEAGRMSLKRKQEEKRLKRAKIFNTILLVAAVASDVSSSGKNRSFQEYANNRVAHSFAYQAIGVKRAVDYGNFANRMQRYDYEEYRWREMALKANTVAPGESVRGFVYLPRVANASYLAITYSLPETASVPLLFRQEIIREKRKRR